MVAIKYVPKSRSLFFSGCCSVSNLDSIPAPLKDKTQEVLITILYLLLFLLLKQNQLLVIKILLVREITKQEMIIKISILLL